MDATEGMSSECLAVGLVLSEDGNVGFAEWVVQNADEKEVGEVGTAGG